MLATTTLVLLLASPIAQALKPVTLAQADVINVSYHIQP